jgi:transposase, IS30 family
MAKRGRPGLSHAEKAELWGRWKAGECVSDIARTLQVPGSRVHHVLACAGGIMPAARRRSPQVLRMEEREEISRGVAAGDSARRIAARLRRPACTVARELARNGGRSAYRASEADVSAWDRARRPKDCRLAANPKLRYLVAGKLAADWSPEQISGWLKQQFPMDPSLRVSHETIYRTLFLQARGALKKELIAHLRTARRLRRPNGVAHSTGLRGHIVDAVPIRERPAEAQDRAVPGHWEGDLLCGGKNTYIATLVERHTRFAMLIKVPGKDSAGVVSALSRHVRKLPLELRRSLTWDRGHEMAEHKKFTVATDVQVYFCDPQSPWQRGSNENTNGLLRQYFPKKVPLSGYSQAYLDKIALRLNTRPRKTLGFQTPAQRLDAVLQ